MNAELAVFARALKHRPGGEVDAVPGSKAELVGGERVSELDAAMRAHYETRQAKA